MERMMARDKWEIDWGATASDYARYRVGYPESFFEMMSSLGIGRLGQSVVDLGTGPGTLARGFARRGCKAIGVDLQQALLDEARKLDEAAGLRIDYRCAPAERTELPDACADVVTSGSSWNWFDSMKTLNEVLRLLKPDGCLLVAYSNGESVQNNIHDVTNALLCDELNMATLQSARQGRFRDWMEHMRSVGLQVETFTHDFAMQYTHEEWRGHVRAWEWTGGSMSSERLASFDRRFAAILKERFPNERIHTPFKIVGVIARLTRKA
jgi:SAM-dependent methyltransferase